MTTDVGSAVPLRTYLPWIERRAAGVVPDLAGLGGDSEAIQVILVAWAIRQAEERS